MEENLIKITKRICKVLQSIISILKILRKITTLIGMEVQTHSVINKIDLVHLILMAVS